ncbi:hypothetical protein SUGI_0098850 [Cryptomeria japonica]|uniref:uncharacterized protein LOC131050951 n=1 Tax=Cryptomeria japonica TaxID=3369 RepID=UPI002408B47A|nr:uncharacterized protein LOC131050951 [Cryptomeria japonica]GLJ08937.1 hypothetical protein SUGI_0098850 [Cryptomeria japonica]
MSESAGSSYSYKHKGKSLQKSGMLTRQQLLHLFDLFAIELGKAEVKKRIADAVRDNQEPVAITTEIQEELLLKMDIDPQFGISCLGKINTVYENDRELMLQFYDFVAKEELACDEAELGPAGFSEKVRQQQKLQEQQLMMLRQMRELPIDDQCSVLKALHEQMEQGQYENSSAVMTQEQIQHLINRKLE